ncbi:MAG TPA: DUF4276 family protein [Gemmatimonadaceae bacterium]|nr:DUF4276 family protein [Gemmatimonadaceae bacterium]
MTRLGLIVEGEGEVAALPVLVRRTAEAEGRTIHALRPHRRSRSSLVLRDELKNSIEALHRIEHPGAVLVVIDADSDCAKELGPELATRAQRSDLPTAVVIAEVEFETWFLYAAESLRGANALKSDALAPENPLEIASAKDWLTRHMHVAPYSPTRHQAAFTARIDLAAARRSRSFAKPHRKVCRLSS